MASVIIGRADCPECGFKSAHVKKSEKCTYRYCPECGSQHHAKTERQIGELLKKTRLTEPSPTPSPSPTEKKAVAEIAAPEVTTPSPTPSEPSGTDTPSAPKRRGLFS